MEIITQFFQYVSDLVRLKEYDEQTYFKLVKHVLFLGIMMGSLGTLWIIGVIIIVNL